MRVHQVLNILEVFLVLCGPYHREAILLFEVVLYESPDLVLLLNRIRDTFLFFKGVFQVLSRAYHILELVLQPKCEVTHDPKERWEVLTHRLRVLILHLLALDLKLLRQVDDQ